jgi:hypothetical protein
MKTKFNPVNPNEFIINERIAINTQPIDKRRILENPSKIALKKRQNI